MKIAIVYIKDGQYGQVGKIAQVYDGPADQSKWGSEYGSSEYTKHLEIPEGMDPRCLEVAIHADKWTKEGQADVYVDPLDETWSYNPGPHYIFSENAQQKADLAISDAVAASEAIVQNAMNCFQQVMKEFAGENLRLGITADGQTGSVLTKLQNVLLAGQSGSLYEVIARAKAIAPADYDAKYITEARLLAFCNKFRVYLGHAPAANLASVDSYV